MNCPQGCADPRFGEDTMREKSERIPLETPHVITGVPGGSAVVEHETYRFLECCVCGWVVDV